MDEGVSGQEDGHHAVMLERAQMVMLVGVMSMAEESMHHMYRRHLLRVWGMRALVLFNVATVAWDLSDVQAWVRWVALLPAWGAWYAFRTSERFAGDLPHMRAALADVREKIKTGKRLANES